MEIFCAKKTTMVVEKIYQKTLSHFVMNTFADLYLHHGLRSPDVFGKMCVSTCEELKNELLSDESVQDIRIVRALNNVHHVVLCRENGNLYFLDPALGLDIPINLTHVLADTQTKVFDAYPHVLGRPRKIFFRSTHTQNIFELERFDISPSRDAYKRFWLFHFDIDRICQCPASPCFCLAARPSNRIIEFVRKNSIAIKLQQDTNGCGALSIMDMIHGELFQESQNEFAALFCKLADQMGTSPQALKEYVDYGYELFQNLKRKREAGYDHCLQPSIEIEPMCNEQQNAHLDGQQVTIQPIHEFPA